MVTFITTKHLNFDDRYQLQYYALFDLADLNQENATIDAYLKAAANSFSSTVSTAFASTQSSMRLGWEYSFANSIYTYADSFLFGEWYQANTSDPLYHDSYKFANKSGISLWTFRLTLRFATCLARPTANFRRLTVYFRRKAVNSPGKKTW